MRKALGAAFAATAILVLAAPANEAAAMPIAPPSATGVAAANSETVTPVHYRARHYRYWAAWPPNYAYLPWRGLYEYPRYYWDVYPVPYAHYYVGPYWGW